MQKAQIRFIIYSKLHFDMKPFFEQRDNDKSITYFESATNFPAHFHSGIEVAYTLSGVTVTSVSGRIATAEKNSLVFFDSGEIHSILECGRYATLIIPEKYLAAFTAFKRSRALETVVFRDEDGALKTLIDELSSSEGQNEVFVQGLVYEFLGIILSRANLKMTKNKSAEGLKPVLTYLNEHYTEKITLDEVAEKFNYNKCYLSTAFNKYFKTSVTGYVNNLRLLHFIKTVRENRGTSLTVAALDSGFNSLQTFYRAFKDSYGVSPKEYLRQEIL